MNTILLTSGTDRQTAAPRRTGCAPCVSPQLRGAAAGDRPKRAALVEAASQDAPAQVYRKWKTAGAGVETALFVSVQAVMMVCIVLVAVQLFATA